MITVQQMKCLYAMAMATRERRYARLGQIRDAYEDAFDEKPANESIRSHLNTFKKKGMLTTVVCVHGNRQINAYRPRPCNELVETMAEVLKMIDEFNEMIERDQKLAAVLPKGTRKALYIKPTPVDRQ